MKLKRDYNSLDQSAGWPFYAMIKIVHVMDIKMYVTHKGKRPHSCSPREKAGASPNVVFTSKCLITSSMYYICTQSIE